MKPNATTPSATAPTYTLNADQTVATFHLDHSLPRRVLNPTEYYYWLVYTRSALVYRGTVDVQRFCAALHYTLQQFDWLFYRLHKDGSAIYADLTTGDGQPPAIQLEIERSDSTSVQHTTLSQCLPTKADARMLATFTDDVEDLQLSAFKLHIHSDGFTIGYYLNHAMHDQHSNVFLMNYIAHVYTRGVDNVTLKQPVLVDVESMLADNKHLIAAELDPPMRYHKPEPAATDAATTEASAPAATAAANAVYDIYFENAAISKLKAGSSQYVSVSDIINAIMVNIYAVIQPQQQSTVETFTYGFVVNVRKALGLGNEAIGNFLVHPMVHLTQRELHDKCVVELAAMNRDRLKAVTIKDFYSDLQWYKNVQIKHEAAAVYEADYDAFISNWTTFNYDEIVYDGSQPHEMIAHEVSQYKVHVISNTTNTHHEKVFRSTVTLPISKVDAVNELANTTQLFRCVQHAAE